MRKLALCFAVFSCLVATSAPARAERVATKESTGKAARISPELDAAVRKLMKLTKAGDMGAQVIDHMLASLVQSDPSIPREFFEAAMKEFKTEELTELVIPIYCKYFTLDDIKGMIRFYESPLGQKVIETQPKVFTESFLAGQQWGMQVGQRIAMRAQELMEAKEKESAKETSDGVTTESKAAE